MNHYSTQPMKDGLPRYFWIGLVLIFCSGAALRVAYFFEAQAIPDYTVPMLDARYHDYWARAMSTGDWTPPADITDPEIQHHPYVRPPLYPYLLAGVYALIGDEPDVPRVAQFLLGLLSAAYAGILAGRWFCPVAGLLASALMASYWTFPYYESQLVEPIVIIPLILFWISITIKALECQRMTYYAFSGLLLGLMVLGRPNALLLLPAITVWFIFAGWMMRLGLRRIIAIQAVFIACAVLAFSPAIIRNVTVSGEWVPITAVGGQNLYLANNPLSDGYSGIAPDIRNWSSFDHPRLVRELGNQVGRSLTYTEASEIWTERSLAYMRENPGRVLALTLKKMLLLIGPREISVDREDEFERMASPILRRLPGGFSWLLAGAITSLMLVLTRNRRNTWRHHAVTIPTLALLVLSASYVPFTITGRYRAAILPLLILLMAAGIPCLLQLYHQRRWKTLAGWAIAGAITFLLVRPNYANYEPSEARWHVSRGLAYGRLGQVERAAEHLARAVQLAPDFAHAQFNYGVALSKLNRDQEAVAALEKSSALEPRAETWQALGDLALRRGDRKALENIYAQAVERMPGHASLHNDFGILFAEAGQGKRAIDIFQRAVDQSPYYFDALRNLAVALENDGRNADALSYYARALMIDSFDGDLNYRMARQLGLAGRYHEAVDHLYRCILIQPDNAEWLGALAWIRATHPHIALRNGQEAVALAKRANKATLEQEPTALAVLAAALAEAGQIDDARATIEKAISLADARDASLLSALTGQRSMYANQQPYRDQNMRSAGLMPAVIP